MSSPIAKTEKSSLDTSLIAIHKKLSHSHRIDCIAREIGKEIAESTHFRDGRFSALDIGCGDMTLTDTLQRYFPHGKFKCVDIHPCPPEIKEKDPRWERYIQFDGKKLPFEDDSFDIGFFSDVLHHIPEESIIGVLKEARRTCQLVVIKDHFERGLFSRNTLRAMDFVGNYGYGITIPKRYFQEKQFNSICEAANLNIKKIRTGLRLYDHLPLIRNILSPDWQMIAVCERRS